jgi:hypothetical protein
MNIKTILFKLNNISINTAVDDIKCALNEIINFITNGKEFESWIKCRNIYECIFTDYEAHDRVQFEFINNSQPERNFYISFRRVDQVNSDVVCERLNRVLQSNSQFLYTDMCTLKAWLIKTPVGSGRRILRPGESLTEFLALKKSIIIVKDMMPHMCLPLCIIVGVEMLFNTTFVKDISHKRYTATKWQILMNKAVDLCIEGGIQHVRDTGMGLDELSIFQSVLDERFRNGVINKRIKIVVFADFEASVLWQGFEDSHNVEQIRILLFANHYYLIKSTTGTFSCQYFCDYCNRRYGRRGDHVCKYRCERCTLAPKCNIDDIHEKYCNDCNRKFYGLNCYQNHIRANVCQKIRFCNLCRSTFRNLRRGEVHVCGMIYCKVCLQKRPSDHQCYIPKYTPKTLKNRLFIFIDFECTQDTVGELDGPEHVPNLCITHQICENCLQYEDKTYACSTCNQREQIFPETCFQDCMGDCIMRKVFSYLYDLENKGFNMIIIGHNIGLYDGHIFLKYLFNNNVNANRVPEMIVNGTKIYAIKVSESIKIIDSLNFFGVALSKLPQMYGFSGYKGFFPHMFNSNNHWNYMGVIPDKKYFVPESMKSSDLVEFNKWYDERAISNEPWIFCEELIRYCSNDVTILRKACVSFYNYFMSHFKFDVFTNAITIASACNKVFRFKFLESDSLGIIPKNGYRMHEKQSVIALQWLYWIEVTRGITIKHAGNGSEKKISSYRVDGYFQDPITREETIFEFYGCYYHGCPKCYDCLTQDDENTLKILERRENTFHRLNYFKNRFRVEVVWECEFRSMLKNDPTILSIANSTPYTEVTPLNPRDAFFGGRTNVIKYYHKVDSNEKIKYYDVCSLYPFINKTYKVPVGHPKVLIGDDANRLANNLIGFEGFVKCKVLPPRDLYHPVLPQKLHNKLMFHLCLKCAETFTETCAHSDEERSFVGTWVSDELKKAVEKGYRILKVYEAWQYTVKTGLFTEYVNAFLKDKAEASGYPEWAVTDDRKNEYIEEFNRKEGVLLDKQNINKNPPKRSTAKLILNSFWGKFGENVDLKSSVKLINDSLEFFRLVTSPDIDISKIIVLNPENLLVVYKETVESRLPLNTINVAIAAYTTAGARLQLYNYLDQLNTRILYFDTDSIIFTEKSGEQSPELGDYLGDLTDELCEYGAGSFISEFVSGGPKNYAFCVTTPGSPLTHYSCKVKGFTLNSKNSEKINFSTIKEMVLKLMGDPDDTHGDDISDDDNVIVTEEMKIRRHGLGRLYTKTEKKVYKVTSGKRKLVGNYNTLPWGFI